MLGNKGSQKSTPGQSAYESSQVHAAVNTGALENTILPPTQTSTEKGTGSMDASTFCPLSQ